MRNLGGQFGSELQRRPDPVRKRLPIYVPGNSLGKAVGINQLRGHCCPTNIGYKVGGGVALGRIALPLVKGGIPDGFGFLPLLYAFRPADFGSLVARLSYGVKRYRIKPAFLLGKAENVVINPIFEAKTTRPVLGRFGRQLFFGFRETLDSDR